jgi:hypothetical protein
VRTALRWSIRRKDGIQEVARPLFGRMLHREPRRRDALCKRIGVQGPAPACVGADKDKPADGCGMVAGEQQREHRPERESCDRGAISPRVVTNPDAASAQSASLHLRGTSSEPPHPGASQAITSTCGLRRSNSSAQIRESSNAPWKSTSGGPLPLRRYAMRTPPTTTSAIVREYASA